MSTSTTGSDALLKEILDGLKALRTENSELAASVDKINGRVNMLAGIKQLKDEAVRDAAYGASTGDQAKEVPSEKTVEAVSQQYKEPPSSVDAPPPRRSSVSKTSKIILTSYPGQAGVDPLPMVWGAKDPAVRGPVLVSRHANTIRRRNGMFDRPSHQSSSNRFQPLVHTEVPIPSIMLLLWQARTWTSRTSQTSQTQSPPPRLAPFHSGAMRRRL